jgi:rhodanese-related sulfurtransferase
MPPELSPSANTADAIDATPGAAVNAVTAVPAAASAAALAHFESSLSFETDCWDVHDALASGAPGFVLLDVRSPALYASGHVPGAINLPHGKIVTSKLAAYPLDTLFVTYCAGPHCNGAARGAIRLARLGRPVKIMIGGITGWLDEGFALATTPRAASPADAATPG